MITLNKQFTNKQLLFWLFLAFILRLFFIFKPGHWLDINTFAVWGFKLNQLSGFEFFNHVWSDYLPLPLLLTKFVAWLASNFNLPFSLIWKLTLVIFEILLLFLIAHFKPFSQSKLTYLLLLFSPPLIINGSLWGQLDTLVSLLLLLSLLATQLPSGFYLSLITFSFAFSLKSLVILVLPFLVYYWFTRGNWHLGFKFILLFSIIVLLPNLYFVSHPKPLTIINFFLHRLIFQASVYPFTTINAFNLWSLLSRFWTSDTFTVLGLNAHFLGLSLFLFAYFKLLLSFINLRSFNFQTLVRFSALSLLSFYTLATRMHERHLLYALPLILTLDSLSGLIIFLLFSLVFSFNNWASLFWLNHHQLWPLPHWLNFSLSLLLIVTFFWFYLSTFWPRFPRKFLFRHRFVFLLFLFAFGLRLIRLNIPHQMIFDEVYHAFTAREFVRGDNLTPWEWWHRAPKGYAYEWTHPPLAKYGMIVGMLLFGQNSFGWRFGSALFGAMSVVLIYLLGRFWFSSKVALLASFLFACDGLSLVQSRIAMNDIYMVFFSLLSLYLAERRFWKLTAFSWGLALASKWSALYLSLPLIYLFLKQTGFNLKSFLSFSRYLLITILVYILSYFPFFIHHSWSQFLQLQTQMWLYHTNLQATHPYQSKPWQWILALRPVWYYVNRTPTAIANIYAQSNPFIFITGLISFFLLPIYWQPSLLISLIAYLSFFLPWLVSPRIMFFYHYLPSLPFFYLLLAYLLYRLPKNVRFFILGFFCFSSLILIFPSVYALPLPKSYWHLLFKLFPSWQ